MTEIPSARWTLSLPRDLSGDAIARLEAEASEIEARSPFGWGHSIDFGPFSKTGLLGGHYLRIAGLFDHLGWLPQDLSGMRVADVGCFTGGLTALLASRGAALVHGVDEMPEHLEQCHFLVRAFGLANVELHEASLYQLEKFIPEAGLDLVLLSGVLYHLSDMLVGLSVLRRLLKPGGVLLIETNAVIDDQRSYANFGRFFAGMWWQPTTLCVRDLCEFTGFEKPETHAYDPTRCLARAFRGTSEIPFVRGMNYSFGRIHDLKPRPMDPRVMAPARPETA